MESFIPKLRFKQPGLVVNCPDGLKGVFLDAGFGFDKSTKNANVIIFFLNKKEFETQIESLLKALEYDTVFWITFPKGTSKIKSDINRDILWNLMSPYGLRPVSNVAIDETWSALRFRPIEAVK